MAVILQGVLLGQFQVPAKSEKSVRHCNELICMGVCIARRTSRVWADGLWRSWYFSYPQIAYHKGICTNVCYLSAGFLHSVVVLVNVLALPVNIPATMFTLPYFSVHKPCRSLTIVFEDAFPLLVLFSRKCIV